MTDIHCHILPDFDDGADCLEESLAMARMAAASGVQSIAATPHFPGVPESLEQLDVLSERFNTLSRAIREEGIPLTLHRGAEILCLPETPELAKAHVLPTLGETDYLLTEFPFHTPGDTMTRMLHDLREAGYRPVVAHPERYGAVQAEPRLAAYWFRHMDCVLQLNKGSALGAFGSRVQQPARLLLDQGLVHIVASDAHSSCRRTPHMSRIRDWLSETCGPEYTAILLHRNPARLLSGRPMVPIYEE